MVSQDPNDGESSDEWTNSVGRRPVLMALGAGTSLALASQYGSVHGREETKKYEQDSDGGGDGGMQNRQCPPCIDPYSGYLQVAETKNGKGQLGNIKPVATVELRVSDADIVFVEEDGGGTATETQTTPTERPITETATRTLTPTEMTETASTGETPARTPPTGTPAGTPAGGEGFPDFYFDPVGIRLRPGDTVEFTVREEIHTVTAYHPRFFGSQQRVPEEVLGFSSPPLLKDDSWYYRFDQPGVYDMMCLPHEGLGMAMRAVVVKDDADVPDGYPEPEKGTPVPSPIAKRVLGASQLEPQNIVEQDSVAWTDLSGVESELPMG